MEPQSSANKLNELAPALCDLRDSWVKVSMVLKDNIADAPSPLRDEVAMLVQRQLARIRDAERGNFD